MPSKPEVSIELQNLLELDNIQMADEDVQIYEINENWEASCLNPIDDKNIDNDDDSSPLPSISDAIKSLKMISDCYF